MKILVTGATGFIGSRLALRARAGGHDVLATGRRLNEKLGTQFAAAGIEVRLGDVTDPVFVEQLMPGITHVCHLAAAWQEVGVPDEYFRKVTVEGAELIADAAARHRVTKLVHCSTSGVHSRFSGEVVTETSMIELTNAYEVAKMEAERLLFARAAVTGLPTIVLRPADAYGPGDLRLLKLFRAIARQRFPLIGTGSGHRHMIFVDDLCDAFLAACAAPAREPQAFLVAGPEVVTLRELVERVARVLGVAKSGFRLPLAPMRVLAAITEDVCSVLNVAPPLYRRRLEFYAVDVQYDIRKALDLLHWSPRTGLDTGLRLTAEWYRQQGLL